MDLASPWLWLIGGVVLLIAEIVAPGFFLLFVGAAAVVTGVFVALLDLGPAAAVALFALYTALAVLAGRRFYARAQTPADSAFLNDPAGRLVGRWVTVTQAIDSEGGRVRVGDSEWSARGSPAPVGAKVRVLGSDGNCLEVAPTPELPAD
jgi:membrane protein implicated in regulation of membrane protease activity